MPSYRVCCGPFTLSFRDLFVSLLLLSCNLLMTSLPQVSARVDYACEFGNLVSSVDSDGHPMEFCPTGMQPPFMVKGDFIWAHRDGRCFECVCEEGIGLACCDCPRRRRG